MAISELPDDMEMVIEREWEYGFNGPCTGIDTNHVRIWDDDDFNLADVVNRDATSLGIEEEYWEHIIRKPTVLFLRTKQVNPFE